jgi:hypothetical protein
MDNYTGWISSSQEPARDETLIVSNSSITLSDFRPMREDRRKELIVRNISTIAINDVITISFGAKPAVTDKGIVLKPGDILNMSESHPDVPIFQGVINVICSQASAIANLSIFER